MTENIQVTLFWMISELKGSLVTGEGNTKEAFTKGCSVFGRLCFHPDCCQ